MANASRGSRRHGRHGALREALRIHGSPPAAFALIAEDGLAVSVAASAISLSSPRAQGIVEAGLSQELVVYGVERPVLSAIAEHLAACEANRGRKIAVWYRKELRKRLVEGLEIEALAQIFLAAVQLHADTLQSISLQLLLPRLHGLAEESFTLVFGRLPADFVLLTNDLVQSGTRLAQNQVLVEVLAQAQAYSLLPQHTSGGRGLQAALEAFDAREGASATPVMATSHPSAGSADPMQQQ